MKKFLTIVLVLLLACGMVACNKNNGEEEKKLKVAMLLPFIGDQSYFDTMNNGLKKADAKYDNVECKLIEVDPQGSADKALWNNAYDEVCENHEYDLIISANESYEKFLYEAARKYPDQLFLNCDCSNWEDPANVYSTNFGLDDLGYVVGALSAALTKTKKVGVVVGKDNMFMNQFISGYCQVLAEKGVEYGIAYPDSFTDTVLGNQVTEKLISQGCDVIWQVAGGLGNGVIEACSKHDDVWCVGVDQDQYKQFESSNPDWAKTVVTSALKNSDVIIETCIDMLVNGTLSQKMGKLETWGIKENGVGLAENDYYLANVSDSIRKEISDTLAKVANGEVAVVDCLEFKDYDNEWPALRDANIIK